jgi:putative addiction module antidote
VIWLVLCYNLCYKSSMTTTVKITAIGNSFGVIIPKEMLAHFHLQKGDEVHLDIDSKGIFMQPFDEDYARQLELAERIMREDRDVLRLLAQ